MGILPFTHVQNAVPIDMKLRLSNKLIAAIIAAFAVVGTLAQAAITMTDITQWSGYDEATGVAHVGNNGGTMYDAKQQQNYQWNNSWSFIYTVDASTLTAGTYSLDTLALTWGGAEGYIVAGSLVMNSDGTGTVTHGGWYQSGKTADIDLSSAKDITFVLSRDNNTNGWVSLAGYVDGNFDTAAFTLTLSGVRLSFSGTVSSVSYGNTGGLTPFNNGNNTYRQVADASVGTFDITKAGYLLGSQVTAADLGKYYTPPSTLLWNSESDATWDLSITNWVVKDDTTPTAFLNDSKAVFGDDGDLVKDITVSSAISADTVDVNDDYSFTVESGQSLTVGTLTVAADKTATVAGEGTISLGSLSGAGNLTVGEAGVVTLNVLSDYTGELGVEDGGILHLGANAIVENLTVEHGETTTQHAGTNGAIKDSLTIGEGGTFKVIGRHDAFGYDANATKDIIMQGAEDHLATLALEQTTTNSVTMTTNIAMHGYSTITSKEGTKGFNTFGGNITVDGVENSIAVIDLRRDVTIDVAAEGALSVGKFRRNDQDLPSTMTVTKTGEGNMTIVEASTFPGTLSIKAGTVSIQADTTIAGLNIATTGTLTVAGGTTSVSGNTNVIGNTIDMQAGSLTLSGSYEITEIAPTGGETTYAGGQHSGNGYATANGTITVYSGAAKDSVVADAATFTYHGAEVTVTDGVYTLPGTQDTTAYYINEDTDSYGWIDTHKKGDLVYGIVVKAGATLQADKDMSMAALAAPSKGTVQIDEGVVVSDATGTQAVKITGAGTYALASGTQTLGSVNIDDLDGVVRLSGHITNINLDDNLQGKNVELSGVSGYFKNVNADSQAVFNGNLRLTDVDAGTPAITVTEGYSRDRAYLVFSGAVSGNGTWELNCGATQHYVFSGDISAWDGTFHVTRSGASYGGTSINFCGDAKEVNASIIKLEAGTLNLIVGDGQSSFSTTFKNTVEASSLTVQEHATAILGGDTTITDSLTLHGLLKTDGGSLSLKDGVSLSLGEGAEMQFGSAMSMKAKQGGAMGVSDNTVIEATSMHSKDGGMGVLNNVNVDIIEDYTIENMSISGSVIDISEGKHLYVKHVNIEADARITDEAAWLDMVDTHGWLDNSNTEASAPVMSLGDTLFYRSGDDAWMRLDHDVSYVALTSELFSNVTMTGSDLWLDLTDLAGTIGSARAFSIAFKDALYDVNGLRVVATVDGVHYLDGYYTTKQEGTTTTLYFSSQIPEPTTSTLSLLALAALAARRRRK